VNLIIYNKEDIIDKLKYYEVVTDNFSWNSSATESFATTEAICFHF